MKLFITCWLVYALHFATNTVREIYPALSLGDHLSLDVSEYLGLHPDIFAIPGRGAYINNNPGASILGAVPYAFTRPLLDRIVARVKAGRAGSGRAAPGYDSIYPMAREFYRKTYEKGLDVKFGLAAAVMQALLMAPLSALTVVVMFHVLLAAGRSPKQSALLALLYAFATPVFYRTAQLNHNLLVGHFAFLAFVLLWQPWKAREAVKSWHHLVAGVLAGWTVVLDYSGVVAVAALSLYVLLRWRQTPSPRRASRLSLFALGVVLSLSVLFAIQWSNFGHPFLPAQHYMPPTTYSPQGYQGMDWPQLDLLWENAFGARYGLFTSAPFLVLALWIPSWFSRRDRLAGPMETAVILVFAGALFLFTAANQFSRMQFNSGVRHMVPAAPFLFLLAAQALLRLPRGIAVAFAVAATYWSWCLAMYRDVEQGLGILEAPLHITLEGVRFPWLSTVSKMGYASPHLAWPILIAGAALLWLLWRFEPKTTRA